MSKLANHTFDMSLLDNLTKLGVYKITHLSKPELFYIGSASGTFKGKNSQKGFYRRFLEHLRNLKNRKHDSRFLQNVVNKYGIEGIRFEIIEIVNTEDRNFILKREQHYLDSLKPAYNSSKTARCPTVPYTCERKQKLSIKMKGKKLPENVYDAVRVPVYQFDKSGNFLNKYNSIQEAANKTKIDRGSISNSIAGKRKSAGGYLWSITDSIFVNHKVLIYQYTLENQLIQTFETFEEVKRKLNINSSNAIRNCIAGNYKQAYGFKWIKK